MMIRQPVVAGTFYPTDRVGLKKEIERCLSGLKTKSDCQLVISPHAGYVYSGKIAAQAISSLVRAESFLIFGPNHHGLGPEFCVADKGMWATPLGNVRVESRLADLLIKKCPFIERSDAGHKREHSIEVQLPLLQHMFKDFTFVPISVFNVDYSESLLKNCIQLGQAAADLVRKYGCGLIASSDFSHYLPLALANQKDGLVIEKILDLDPAGLFRTLARIDGSVCGYGPIAIVLAAARELELKAKMIGSASSADISGDFGSVVTYHAIGFYK